MNSSSGSTLNSTIPDPTTPTSGGPRLFGFTPSVAQHFASHPLASATAPGRVVRVDRNLLVVAVGTDLLHLPYPLTGETAVTGDWVWIGPNRAGERQILGVLPRRSELSRKRAFEDAGDGMSEYRRLGYIPSDSIREAVSKTLEYAYDDWAMAKLAEAAGATDDAEALRERSRNYRHSFDRNLTFMRARLADGRWAEPFEAGSPS